MLRIQRQLEEQTRDAIDERHKEALLREQLHQIRKELGEEGESGEEVAELRKAVEAAGMPEEALEQARKELKRLERMSDASAEYSMLRTWLDWMLQLPWSKLDDEVDRDRERASRPRRGPLRPREDQAPHRRVPRGPQARTRRGAARSCASSARRASARRRWGRASRARSACKFARVSLGGVHDEAEIRGHRRTYIGALPGNIVQAIRKAGTRNPVLMLDEIDKLGAGIQGDPSSALLEVLDPEQNNTFRDNYLGLPFDLSKVMFIATANVLDTIPGPLRDRMEVIELTGYTEDEKVEIAKRYLMRRQLEANGLKPEQATITDAAIATDRARSHARGRRAQPRAHDRCGPAQRRGAHRRRLDRAATHRRRRSAADPRRRALRERGRDAHQRAGRSHRARLDAGRRRHPVHRGDAHAGQRQADPHRSARRRHEGERAGGVVAGEVAERASGHRLRHCSTRATCTSTYRRARFRRTVRARAWRCSPRWSRCSPNRTVRTTWR